MIDNFKNAINENLNNFFLNWQPDETPISILSLLLTTYLNEPFGDSTTEKEEQVISEQITRKTMAVGFTMKLFHDLKENHHLKSVIPEIVKEYFECNHQHGRENIRELLVHFMQANEKQNFEVALTVPAVGAIMDFLTRLHKTVNHYQLQSVELN